MQFRTIAVIASLSALSIAQSLPSCAVSCFAQATANMTVCSPSDSVCICTTGKSQFTQLVTPCVMSACDASDQAQVVPAAALICEQAEASASGGSTPAATGSMTSSGSSTKATGSTTASTTGSSSSSGAMALAGPLAGFGGVMGLVVGMVML